MADHTVIRHQLDLLLRLIDTTTGSVVSGRGVELLINEKLTHPLVKESGTYLFLNIGRENFELTVRAFGYIEKKIMIEYEALDKMLPSVELHLLPGPYYTATQPCYTLEGTLPGITSLEAVKIGESPCFIRGFDERKRILTVFNPHHLELNRVFYAVVNSENETYESFEIISRISNETYKINKTLEKEFTVNFPICHIVFGMTYPDGRYLLRVRNNSCDAKWLLRYTTIEKEVFQSIDFNKPETLKLVPHSD